MMFPAGGVGVLITSGDWPAATPTVRLNEELAAITATTDEHIAMYACTTRTALEDGFDKVAGKFETLTKATRVDAPRPRGIAGETT